MAEALELVRLPGFAKRRAWELSGGQQQRVALARALINRPTVLLLDEPLAALDRKLRREMQIELQNLQREVGITFVLVTHDQEEALSMSDTIGIMRDGRVEQFASPRELYAAPANRYVADFVGESNFFAGEVVAADARGATIRTSAGIVLAAPLERQRRQPCRPGPRRDRGTARGNLTGRDRVAVADLANNQRGVEHGLAEPAREVIEHHHPLGPGAQLQDDVGADVAGAPGD